MQPTRLCKRGHPQTPKNVVVYHYNRMYRGLRSDRTKQVCILCNRIRGNALRAKERKHLKELKNERKRRHRHYWAHGEAQT